MKLYLTRINFNFTREGTSRAGGEFKRFFFEFSITDSDNIKSSFQQTMSLVECEMDRIFSECDDKNNKGYSLTNCDKIPIYTENINEIEGGFDYHGKYLPSATTLEENNSHRSWLRKKLSIPKKQQTPVFSTATLRGVVKKTFFYKKIEYTVSVYVDAGERINLELFDALVYNPNTTLSEDAKEVLSRITALRSGDIPEKPLAWAEMLSKD